MRQIEQLVCYECGRKFAIREVNEVTFHSFARIESIILDKRVCVPTVEELFFG